MPTELQQISMHSSRRWLLASVLLAVLYQAILVASSPAIAKDGIAFVTLAKDLAQSPVAAMRQADQHPGYPAMILAGRWLVLPLIRSESILPWVWGARLVSGVFGVLVIVTVWLVASRVFDYRAAAVAATLVAALPLFRENAADVLSDTPHLFFYALAVFLVIEGMMRREWLWFLGAGASSGAAYWIRPEGLSVVIVAAVVLPLWALRYRTMMPGKVLACVGALVVAGAAVSMPYFILSGKFSSKITNKEFLLPPSSMGGISLPALSGGSPSGAGPVEETGTRAASASKDPVPAAPSTSTAKGRTGDHDGGPLRIIGAGIAELTREIAQGLRWVLLVPLALGLLAPLKRRSREEPRALVIGLVVFHALLLSWLFYAGRYISHRHIMTTMMMIMPWIAAGTLLVSDKLSSLLPKRDERGEQRRGRLVLGVLLLALVALLTPRTLRPLHSHDVPIIETSMWLRVQAKPGDAVLSNSPYVPFFAQMPGRVITKSEADAGVNLSEVGPPYRFVAFDLKSECFDGEWLTQLSGRYEPLEVIGVPSSGGIRTLVLRPNAPGP